MNYLAVANSEVMFVLCLIPVSIVIVMALIFLRIAWKEGLKIGLSRESMRQIITSSALFSIIPSVAVLLMLMALTFILGKYFPWLRLSVIGSGIYETMAANLSLSAFALKDFTALTLADFSGVMLIMTTGILVGSVLNIFFLKRYDYAIRGSSEKHRPFIPILINAMFIGILVEWVAPGVLNFENKLGVVSMVTGLLAMLLCLKIESWPKWRKMESFSMSLAMLAGMLAAIVGNQLMKG